MALLKLLVFMCFLLQSCMAARKLTALVKDQGPLLEYHNGPLLRGPISVNLIWYGSFKPSQRAIVADFISSLYAGGNAVAHPSVATWWKTTEKYYSGAGKGSGKLPHLVLAKQVLDEGCSLGKSLSSRQLLQLAARGAERDAINVVLTAKDVAVEGFCMSRCGTHRASGRGRRGARFAYVWVGNSEAQCPGLCAWPFHQPVYGPQQTPLVAPNGDVGLDGVVINLASLLAGTVTNPFGNGFYQGSADAPLEAASACPAVFGKGAYPGYAGALLVDAVTGASFNAHGLNGRKYLLPAMFDPSTSTCSALV